MRSSFSNQYYSLQRKNTYSTLASYSHANVKELRSHYQAVSSQTDAKFFFFFNSLPILKLKSMYH